MGSGECCAYQCRHLDWKLNKLKKKEETCIPLTKHTDVLYAQNNGMLEKAIKEGLNAYTVDLLEASSQ